MFEPTVCVPRGMLESASTAVNTLLVSESAHLRYTSELPMGTVENHHVFAVVVPSAFAWILKS